MSVYRNENLRISGSIRVLTALGLFMMAACDVRAGTKTETATPSDTPTATAPATFIPTETATVPPPTETPPPPTYTPTPLAAIDGCISYTDTLDIFETDPGGTKLQVDRRDAASSLPPGLEPGDGIIEGQEAGINCWLAKVSLAYADNILQPGHITTFEKMLEMFGVSPKNYGDLASGVMAGLDLSVVHRTYQEEIVAGNFSEGKGVAIYTSAEHLSESLVKLSESAARAARAIDGDYARVATPKQIFGPFRWTYALEGEWYRGVNESEVDEVGVLCPTERDGASSRLAQPEGDFYAQWDNGIPAGSKNKQGGVWHLSNQDGLLIVSRLVGQDELAEARGQVRSNDHYMTIVRVSNHLSLLVMVFDLRNEVPQFVNVYEAVKANDIGSGDQLKPCGFVFTPTPTLVAKTSLPQQTDTQSTPTEISLPSGGDGGGGDGGGEQTAVPTNEHRDDQPSNDEGERGDENGRPTQAP